MVRYKDVSWFRIIGVFLLMVFITQIFCVIQLFIYQHYRSDFTPSNIFTNLIIYTGALLTIVELLPKDFIFKNRNAQSQNSPSASANAEDLICVKEEFQK
jgi:hypothetical protein